MFSLPAHRIRPLSASTETLVTGGLPRWAPSRAHLGTRAVRVLLGAAVLAAASRMWLPFAATAVPFTLQPQAVLVVAATLGAREGVAAVLVWFAAALAGVPVFAGLPGTGLAFVGPTAGYLLSYLPVAAYVGRYGRSGNFAALGHWLLGAALTLGLGTFWLAAWVGLPAAVAAGFLPFACGDAGKAVAAFVARRLLVRGR